MCTIDRGIDEKDVIPLPQKHPMTIEEKLGKAITMRRRQQLTAAGYNIFERACILVIK